LGKKRAKAGSVGVGRYYTKLTQFSAGIVKIKLGRDGTDASTRRLAMNDNDEVPSGKTIFDYLDSTQYTRDILKAGQDMLRKYSLRTLAKRLLELIKR
jgi:hypothetical protein